MAALSFIIGILGNIISILVFTSPIGTFKRIVNKKSTENFKGLPYVSTLLSTSLWTFYGLLKPGGLLIVTVNGVGAALQAIYVTLFICFASKDKRINMIKLAAGLNIGLMGILMMVILLAIHGRMRLIVVGSMCAGLTVGMYAAPLAAMRTVMRTKSVEYMPFFLSFFLFLNGGIWTIYSVLVKDYFIGVPNSVGLVLGSAQLVVYMVFKNKTPNKKLGDEESSSHDLFKSVEMKESEDERERNQQQMREGVGLLSKGRSLPTQTISRQHSLQGIIKTLSLNPYELHSIWPHLENMEN